MNLKKDERIDDLEYSGLKIIQKENGFCFGIDSILISDFAKEIKSGSVGLDLGTGTGIISILLAAKTNLNKIIGIEVQKDIANMAKRSIRLNNLQDKIEIKNIDIRDIEQKSLIERGKFDCVVTNPPYKKQDTGKTNKNEYKYLSRHETTANLETFIKVTKIVLKDKGSIYMVHRPDRLVDILELMRKYKIEPKKIRFVYSTIEKNPVLVLIKGVKNAMPFLKIEKPLIIYNSKGEYTDEIYKIYCKNK